MAVKPEEVVTAERVKCEHGTEDYGGGWYEEIRVTDMPCPKCEALLSLLITYGGTPEDPQLVWVNYQKEGPTLEGLQEALKQAQDEIKWRRKTVSELKLAIEKKRLARKDDEHANTR